MRPQLSRPRYLLGATLLSALVGVTFAFGVPESQQGGCGGPAVEEETAVELASQAVRQRCSGQQRELSTDRNHCGACNHSCLGGTCKQGKCQPLALTSANQAKFLAIDGSNAYWTSYHGTVKRVPLSGGSAVTLASGFDETEGIAVDTSYIYFTANSRYAGVAGKLYRVGLGGGTPTQLAKAPFGDSTRGRIFLTGGNLYWSTLPGTLYVTPTGGYVWPRTSEDAQFVVGNAPQSGRTYAFNGSYFYWKDEAQGQLRSAGTNGSEAVLATGVASGGGLVVADAYRLLFTASSGIYWMPTSGAQAPGSVYGYLEDTFRFIGQLALDPQNLYWAESTTSSISTGAMDGSCVIQKKGLSGTPRVQVATVSDFPNDLVVDANAVYVAGTQSIWKIAK